jgi:hypothetical protein
VTPTGKELGFDGSTIPNATVAPSSAEEISSPVQISDTITGKHPTNARAGLAPGTSDTITGKRPTNAAVGSVLLSSQMQGDCDLIAKEEDKGWMMMG